ncbi:MAG: 2-hydroxyacid dehydrogenase [Oscillospiraceae bacterium]|jgi:phosphoglycerate dehydrogenase-like enzyme
MNIVLMEPLGISEEKLRKLSEPLISAGHDFRAYDSFSLDQDELISRAKDADAVIIANHPLPGAVIRACSRLKFISVAFVGIDHVDTGACVEAGIHVSNTGGYCTDAVAELAVGLAIGCLRNVVECHESVMSCRGKGGLRGNELSGKTVGIVGTGAIGLRAAALFRDFRCSVLAYSRSVRPEAEFLGVEYVSLDEVMSNSDIVSLHVPLTPDTKGLIGSREISLMKPGAILINTSRGPVVDTVALAEALRAGKIKAGIDVYDSDPPLSPDHPLIGAPGVICTPHVGFDTVESIDRRADMAFENVTSWMSGRLIRRMI